MTHTKVPAGLRALKLEPEVEFRRKGAFFRTPFWGHISAVDCDIFTKFAVCVENGVPQRVEWSTYAILEYPRWRTAAILKYLSRHNSATDCPTLLRLCTMTHTLLKKLRKYSVILTEPVSFTSILCVYGNRIDEHTFSVFLRNTINCMLANHQ